MEQGKVRMLANLIELNKIEVKLSKKYYGGISPKFYLRDLTKETLIELSVCETCEDDICVKYYFKDVHIDLNHHYEMVDNYGLSAILQYVRLSELDDFDELFYYDGVLGPLYQKNQTIFKVWAPTALEVMVKVGDLAYTCLLYTSTDYQNAIDDYFSLGFNLGIDLDEIIDHI